MTMTPQEERDIYAAARRAAQDDRVAWRDHYFGALIREVGQPLRALTYRVMQLADKPSKQVMEDLRMAATLADRQLDYGYSVIEADPLYGDRVNAEVVRLREYVRTRGQRLHRQWEAAYGARQSGPCTCEGCELIRGMDRTEVPT